MNEKWFRAKVVHEFNPNVIGFVHVYGPGENPTKMGMTVIVKQWNRIHQPNMFYFRVYTLRGWIFQFSENIASAWLIPFREGTDNHLAEPTYEEKQKALTDEANFQEYLNRD